MKLAPCLYVVTRERVILPKSPEERRPTKGGGHFILAARPFATVEPTVVLATTWLWLAKLAGWWHHGSITYDNHALQEHQMVVEDYT